LVNVGCAAFLAYLNEVLVEHFVGKPLEEKFPHIDRWWLIYVALAAGTAIVWFVGLNIFGDLIPAVLGRILTGIIISMPQCARKRGVLSLLQASGDRATPTWLAPTLLDRSSPTTS
jgi:hypothetical protein